MLHEATNTIQSCNTDLLQRERDGKKSIGDRLSPHCRDIVGNPFVLLMTLPSFPIHTVFSNGSLTFFMPFAQIGS